METLTQKSNVKVHTGFWICKEERPFHTNEKVRFIMGPRNGLCTWIGEDGNIAGSTSLLHSLDREPIVGYSLKDNKILHQGVPTGYVLDPDVCNHFYGPEKKMPWENIDLEHWTNFYKRLFG